MVEPFDVAIGLWMPRTCPIVLDIIALENSLKLLRSEFFTIVGNDLSGFSICPDYIFQDFDCHGRRAFFKGVRERSCGGIVNGSDDIDVSTWGFGQGANEIDFPELEY